MQIVSANSSSMKQLITFVLNLFVLSCCSSDSNKDNNNSIFGEYFLLDKNNTRTKVELKTDFTVSGFYDFKRFDIIGETQSGQIGQLRELCFKVSDYSNICFVYVMNKDTLKLYKSIDYEDKIISTTESPAFIFIRH